MEFNTALLHKNFSGDKASGSTMTPIYQVSAFSHSSAEQLEKVFNNKAPGYAYSRIGNPTVASFEARIAALENGAGAVACSSGMAAVTMALLNILESGDEIIVGAGLFGGTIDLLKDLEAFGITAHLQTRLHRKMLNRLSTSTQEQCLRSLSAIRNLMLWILRQYQILHTDTIYLLL